MTNNPYPNQESWDWPTQRKRLEGFLSRCWIPITPEEQEVFEGVKKTLLPYVETLMKQYGRTEIQKARREAVEEALDFIANNEGWEESRDLYASLLGVPRIYKGKIAKGVDYLLLVNYQKGKE